jgi:ATPase subunit of ABC transporter with duplicated ATPase domains
VSRLLGLAVVLGLMVMPSMAHAQRGRNVPAMSPYGPIYNPTQTPEWRQAGGNYEVWEQIMMQKMAAQEQAAFQKQLAAYQKWAKANPAAAKALQDANNAQVGLANVPSRKKKKPTLKQSTAATAKAADAKNGVKKEEAEDTEETTATKTPAASRRLTSTPFARAARIPARSPARAAEKS